MSEVLKKFLIIFELLPFLIFLTWQMQYLEKYKCLRLGTLTADRVQ